MKTPTKSFLNAQRLYEKSVILSRTWLSKYYPQKYSQFEGVSIEKIQAFSQHHFFSCLLQNMPIDDIWSQYPNVNHANENLIIRRLLFPLRITKILINILTQETAEFGQLNKQDLVLISSGRHLTDLRYLIIELNKKFRILVAGKILSEDLGFLKKSKIDFINIQNGRQFLDRKQKLLFILNFLKGWQRRDSNKLLGTNEWKERLWYLKLDQFPEICALVNLAKIIFTRCKPSLVLTSSSNDTFGATFTLVAQKFNIPVAEFQHGFISWELGWEFSLCDHMLVWGKIPKKLYRKYARNLVSVGYPLFQKSSQSKLHKINQILKILILWSPPSGYWSLYQQEPNEQTLKSLLSVLSRNKNFFITIRSHPSYSVEADLKNYIINSNVSISNQVTLLQDIKKHDIVITGSTTAGFVAILYSKPLLFFDNSWLTQKFGHPFINSGSAINVPVNSLGKIDQYILNLLNDKQLLVKQRKAQNRFVNNYCAKFGKDSWIAIEKFIRERISSNNHSWKKV